MRLRWLPALAAAAVLVLTGTGRTEDAKANLKVGDKAPTFQGTDEQGNIFKSSDHVGKKFVVVYFFPAAFTGG